MEKDDIKQLFMEKEEMIPILAQRLFEAFGTHGEEPNYYFFDLSSKIIDEIEDGSKMDDFTFKNEDGKQSVIYGDKQMNIITSEDTYNKAYSNGKRLDDLISIESIVVKPKSK